MATQFSDLVLRSGRKVSLAVGTDPTYVIGTSAGREVVTIAAGVEVLLDKSFNTGGDTIKFLGNAASYSIVAVNSSLVRVTDASGTSVTIPVGRPGLSIEFADATRTLKYDSVERAIKLIDDKGTPANATDDVVQVVGFNVTAVNAGNAPPPPPPVEEKYTLTTTTPRITEGDSGERTITFLLTLDKAPTSSVTLNYQTVDKDASGSASANDDYEVTAGQVTFGPGQQSATVQVKVYGDTIVEGPETIELALSGSKLVASQTLIGTIVDNDAAQLEPSYALTGSTAVSEGGIATFSLKTTGVPAGSLVGYRITGTGSAATLSSTGTFTVDADGNAVISIPVPTNSTIGDTGAVTIELLNGKSQPVAATVTDVTPTTYSADAITAANAASGVLTINVAGSASQSITLNTDQIVPTNGFVINSSAAPVNVTSTGGADVITLTGNGNNVVNTGNADDRVVISGSGNNTIVTGAGSDRVTTIGSGSNRIEVGTGDDTVIGGSGADTIVVASGDLGANDRIDGGLGDDTIIISGNNNVINQTNVVSVENVVLQGTTVTVQDLVSLSKIKSIQGSSATSEVTISNLAAGDVIDLTGLSLTTIKSITLNGTGTVTLKAGADDFLATGAFLRSGVTVNLETDVAGYKALTAGDIGVNGSKTVTGRVQELIDNKTALAGATTLVVSGDISLADISALADAGISATKTVSLSVSELLNAAKYPDQYAALVSANTLIQVTGSATVAQAALLITSYGTQIAAYQAAAAGNKGIAIADVPSAIGASAAAGTVADLKVSSLELKSGDPVNVADAGRLAALTVTGSYSVQDTAAAITGAITGGVVPPSLAKAASISLTANGRVVDPLPKTTSTQMNVGDTVVTLDDVDNLAVGDTISGVGIAPGTKIQSINAGAKQITLTNPVTAQNASGATLDFGATSNALELNLLSSKLVGGFDLNLTNVVTLSNDDLLAIGSAVNVSLAKAAGGKFSITEVNSILNQNNAAKVNQIEDTAQNLALNASKLSAATGDIFVSTTASVDQANKIKGAIASLLAAGSTANAGTGQNSYKIADTKGNILAPSAEDALKASDGVTVDGGLNLTEALRLHEIANASANDRLAPNQLTYSISASASDLAAALVAVDNTAAVAALAQATTVTATGTATVAEAKILGAQYSGANQVDSYKIADTVDHLFSTGATLAADIDATSDAALARATELSVSGKISVAQMDALQGVRNLANTLIFDNKYGIEDTAGALAAKAKTYTFEITAVNIASSTVTVSSVTGLTVGAVLTGGNLVPDGAKIVAISGTTITLSLPPLAAVSVPQAGTASALAELTAANSITVKGDAAVADLAGLKALNDALVVAGKAPLSFALTDDITAIVGVNALGSASPEVVNFAKSASAIKVTGSTTSVTIAALDDLASKAGTKAYTVEITDRANSIENLSAGILGNSVVTKLVLNDSPLSVANAKDTITEVGASAAAKLEYNLTDTITALLTAADATVVRNAVNLVVDNGGNANVDALQAKQLRDLTGTSGTVTYSLADSYDNIMNQDVAVADGATAINVSNASLKVDQYEALLARAGTTATVTTSVSAEAIIDTAAAVSAASATVLAHTSGVTLTDNASLTLDIEQAKALVNSTVTPTGYDVTVTPANSTLQVKIVDTTENILAAKTAGGPINTYVLGTGSYKVVTYDTATLDAAKATSLLQVSEIVATFNLADNSNDLVIANVAIPAVAEAQQVTVTATSTDPTNAEEAKAIFEANANVTFDVVTTNANTIKVQTVPGVYDYAASLAKAGKVVLTAADSVADIKAALAAAGSRPVEYSLTDTAAALADPANQAVVAGANKLVFASGVATAEEAAVLAQYADKFAPVTLSASAVSTSDTVTFTSTTGLYPGALVSGVGVPPETYVVSFTGTTAVLSRPVNIASGATLTFGIEGSFPVTDTASDLVANLVAVKAAGGFVSLSAGQKASVDEFVALKTELGGNLHAVNVDDTAAAIADFLLAGGMDGVASFTFTGSKDVTAAQAAALDPTSATGLVVEDDSDKLLALNTTNLNAQVATYKALDVVELSVAKDLIVKFTAGKAEFALATTAERFVKAFTYDTNSGTAGIQPDAVALSALADATALTVDGISVTMGSKNAALVAGSRSTYNTKIVGTVDQIKALDPDLTSAAGFVIVDTVYNITDPANAALVASSAGYVVKDTARNLADASASVLNSTQKALGIEVDGPASISEITTIMANTNVDSHVVYSLKDNSWSLAPSGSASGFLTGATGIVVDDQPLATVADAILAANAKATITARDNATDLLGMTDLAKLVAIIADSTLGTPAVDPINVENAGLLLLGKGANASLEFHIRDTAAAIAGAGGPVLSAARSLTVATTNPNDNLAGPAQAKILAGLSLTNTYRVAGTAADLTDDQIISEAELAKASVVSVNGTATVEQAIELIRVGNLEKGAAGTADAGKYVLSITDSAKNIAKFASAGLFDSLSSASVVTVNSYTDALTAAEAKTLADIDAATTKLTIPANNVKVSDEYAALISSANASALATVASIDVKDPVKVFELNRVRALNDVGGNGSQTYTYKLEDGVAALIQAGFATIGDASSVRVTGVISVQDMATIETRASTGTVDTSTAYETVSGNATELFGTGTTLNETVATKAENIDLTGPATVAQVKALLADSDFDGSYSVADSAANIISAINQDDSFALLKGAGAVGLGVGGPPNVAQAAMINANLTNETSLALLDTAVNLELDAFAETVANAGSVVVDATSDGNDGLSAGITSAKVTYRFDTLAEMDGPVSGNPVEVIYGKAGDVIDLTGVTDWNTVNAGDPQLVLDSGGLLLAGEYQTQVGFYSAADGSFTASASGTDIQILIGTDLNDGADEMIVVVGITTLTPGGITGSGLLDVNTFTFG